MFTIKYTIGIKDFYNRKTTKTFTFNNSTPEISRPIMLDLIQDLDDVIAGAITSLQETVFVPLTSIKANPIAGSNIDEAFVFVGELNDAQRTLYSLRIPTPKKALVRADGTVDLEHNDVEKLLNDFTGTIYIPVSDGERVRRFLRGVLEK